MTAFLEQLIMLREASRHVADVGRHEMPSVPMDELPQIVESIQGVLEDMQALKDALVECLQQRRDDGPIAEEFRRRMPR
jgi:hypothetical protein